MRRFQDRFWRLCCDNETGELLPSVRNAEPDEATLRVVHRTIDAVTSMTEDLRFNTAISQMMVCVNELNQLAVRPRAVLETVTLLLAPYAPHLAEEIWAKLGHKQSLAHEPWPVADPRHLVADTVTVVVQVNGKLRDQIEVPAEAAQDAVIAQAKATQKIVPWLEGKTLVKEIYVAGKLVNLVVK